MQTLPKQSAAVNSQTNAFTQHRDSAAPSIKCTLVHRVPLYIPGLETLLVFYQSKNNVNIKFIEWIIKSKLSNVQNFLSIWVRRIAGLHKFFWDRLLIRACLGWCGWLRCARRGASRTGWSSFLLFALIVAHFTFISLLVLLRLLLIRLNAKDCSLNID